MRAGLAIYSREMRAYFFSPIAYVLIVAYLAITGYFFAVAVGNYSMLSMQAMQNPMMQGMNLLDWVVSPLMGNQAVILMLITPLITMRLLAEEKRTGTLELLLSYPLGDGVVVLAKFLAGWSVALIMLIAGWVPMGLVFYWGDPHLPGFLSGALGLALMSGAYVAVGLWASSLTENQIVAAVIAFAALLILWVLGWSAGLAQGQAGDVLEALAMGTHFQGFPRGLVDTADLAYFVLFIGFFVFLSIRMLEAKRWRA